MSESRLITLYRSLLNAAGMVATDDGFISGVFGENVKPAIIDGKRMVLPTKEHQANPKTDTQILFHPLSENIMRGASEVLEKYRDSMILNLNLKIGVLANHLLTISTSTNQHKRLSPDQSEFLSYLKNADDKTLEAFHKILKAMGEKPKENKFVHIFLKARGGKVKGTNYRRAAIVSFPFYEELKKGGDVYGVKLRVKDRESLVNLMEYIFTTIAEEESYNVGSNSGTAPFMDALMRAVMLIASSINEQFRLFANIMNDGDDNSLLINDEWVDAFENIEAYEKDVRLIPMQAGNEGVNENEDATSTETVVRPTSAVAAPASAFPQKTFQPIGRTGYQAQNEMVKAPNNNGTISFEALKRANPSLGHPGSNNMMMMPQPGYYQPNNMMPNNGWGNNNMMPGFNSGNNWNRNGGNNYQMNRPLGL